MNQIDVPSAPPLLIRERRGRLVASGLAAVLLAFAAVGLGASPSSGSQSATGVEITPALIEQDLPGRAVKGTVLIINNETEPRRLTVTITGLGNDLDGAPEFVDPSPSTKALRVSEPSFVLAPGEKREIGLEGSIPDGGPGLYAAVVAEYAPTTPKPTGSVETRTRVASLVLLRAPRPWKETVEIVGVGIQPGAPGAPVQVFAAVKDTGNVHVRPSGTARLVKDGVELATVPLPAANILPGYARRLVGSWTPPPGLSGTVDIEVQIDSPKATGRASVSFDAGAPRNPAATIQALRANGKPVPAVTLTLTNTGNVDLSPSVTLTATEGTTERARTVLPIASLARGASAPLDWKPDLNDGVYLVRAQATSGELVLAEATTGLRVGSSSSADEGAETTRKGGRSVTPLIIVLAIALLVFVLVLLARQRKKDQGDDLESAAPDSSVGQPGAGTKQ